MKKVAAIAALIVIFGAGCTWRGGDFAHPHGEITACIVSAIDAEGKAVPDVAARAGVFVSPGDECNINSLTPVAVAEIRTNLWARRILGNGVFINVLCSSSDTHRGLGTATVTVEQTGGCSESWAYDPSTQWFSESMGSVYMYGNWYHSTTWFSPTELR